MNATRQYPLLLLLRGLPGSGKSTLAEKIICDSSNPYTDCIEADQWMNDKEVPTRLIGKDAENSYLFRPSRLAIAHKECLQLAKRMILDENKYVIVANTFSTIQEMRPYLSINQSDDSSAWSHVRVGVFTCTDHYGSVHGVPETTIDRMRTRWQDMYDGMMGSQVFNDLLFADMFPCISLHFDGSDTLRPDTRNLRTDSLL